MKLNHLQQDQIGVSSTTYNETKAALADLLIREEYHWKQRAKMFWLKDDDMNTKFFHGTASAKEETSNS